MEPAEEHAVSTHSFQVIWRARKSDESNGGYSQQVLEDIFAQVSPACQCAQLKPVALRLSASFLQFGSLHHVLVSAKKKGKALVAFDWPEDAVSLTLSHHGCYWS